MMIFILNLANVCMLKSSNREGETPEPKELLVRRCSEDEKSEDTRIRRLMNINLEVFHSIMGLSLLLPYTATATVKDNCDK